MSDLSLHAKREKTGRVAAGAIAEKYLRLAYGVEIVAFVSSVGSEFLFPPSADYPTMSTNPAFLKLIDGIDRAQVDAFQPVRCPDAKASKRMEELIAGYRDRQDSIGGQVTCVIRNSPTGLGEPCFDKLEAVLAHAMLSIPATKAFEIGSGFGGCQVPGSVHNDAFIKAPAPTPSNTNATATSTSTPSSSSSSTQQPPSSSSPSSTPHSQSNGTLTPRDPNQNHNNNTTTTTTTNRKPRLTTKTNNSGGIQGGITNGAHIFFTVGFKPPATIGQAQVTAGYDEADGTLEAKGRHDPCVVPRAVPIVEAMAALVLMDAVLAQGGRAAAAAAAAGSTAGLMVGGGGDGDGGGGARG